MGKIIYQPAGKAQEYAKWAANFYNGCSARCEYCYNRKGITAKVLGGDIPTLKKCLQSKEEAVRIFEKELFENIEELKKHGLFFNFVSDPCLKETFELNFTCIDICDYYKVPVKLLTKQTWWINASGNLPKNVAYGITLTGHDKLEPGGATNKQRIEAMKKLHDAGFKTWASIEPIIDFASSFSMIRQTINFCDHYKIGLKSGGTRYDREDVREFIKAVTHLLLPKRTPIYFKDSIIKVAGISRDSLSKWCVTRDFNL